MKVFNLILLTILLFSISNKTVNAQIGRDSAIVFHVTDSIASYELKVYDEKSGRQTGVPRMLHHYNRWFSYDEKNKIVFVYYSFNINKFYTNGDVEYIMSTGFPDFISIAYDLKTKQTRILPEG